MHAGIYYPVGSLKATLCRRGGQLLKEYCLDRGLEYREIGKLIDSLWECSFQTNTRQC